MSVPQFTAAASLYNFTHILQPGDPADPQILIESLRPTSQPWDVDLVVGRRGPIASPELCNGLMIPIVIFDQVYSFDPGILYQVYPARGKDHCEGGWTRLPRS